MISQIKNQVPWGLKSQIPWENYCMRKYGRGIRQELSDMGAWSNIAILKYRLSRLLKQEPASKEIH